MTIGKFTINYFEKLLHQNHKKKHKKATSQRMLLFPVQPENKLMPLGSRFLSQEFKANFATEILKLHNRARAYYGDVPALMLDTRLNQQAQRYADYLASTESRSLDHSKTPNMGENLCRYFNSIGRPLTPAKVMNEFLKQARLYDFNTGDYSKGTCHFTQVVWKASRRLGVGVAKSTSGHWFAVCNYDPPGNMSPLFRQNVFNYFN
jgi:uncharacterized protein YkwD